jgi:hypothetical protein
MRFAPNWMFAVVEWCAGIAETYTCHACRPQKTATGKSQWQPTLQMH